MVYNVYFHPLRRYPGPKLWAASDLPRYFYENKGTLEFKIRYFFFQEGDGIRYSPNALSTTNSAVYKDVYGYGKNDLVKETGGEDKIKLKPNTRGKIVDYTSNFHMFYN